MPIKMINIGESGGGKTCALAALLAVGYNVRVLDLDNGIEALVSLLTHEKSKYPKDAITRLRWRTITEPMRVLNGNIVPRQAIQYPTAVDMLESWKGDKRFDRASNRVVPCEDKLGTIYNWTDREVLNLDTLSALGNAAINHKLMMEGKLGMPRTSMEAMRDAGSAQAMIEKFLQFMADDSLKCHVIINTHVNWAKEDGSNAEPGYEGTKYGFPSAIGKALNLKVAKNFNHMLMTRRIGVEQRIYTRGVGNVALKSGAPLNVKESYPLSTGLADYFRDVLGSDPQPLPAIIPAIPATNQEKKP